MEHASMEGLEKILGDFKEAIVICDPQAWILLFNPQAKQLFKNTLALNIRHSLFGLCHQAPFEDAFRLLQHRAAAEGRFGAGLSEVKFICATIKEAMLLNCHLRLIPVEQLAEPVFVLFFTPLPQHIDETGWKASFLATMIEELRAPLANLNAAAENLQANPEMARDERIAFETVVATESADLIRRFEAVVQESRTLTYSQWPLTDIYSSDLLRCVARELRNREAITVTMTGVPLWLHADSHAMMLTLEALIRAVHLICDVAEIDIEVLPGNRKVYLDIVWQGETVPQAIVDSWFQLPLSGATVGMTVADVLERHGSDMWCQQHPRDGYARLRIPAPDSRRPWDEEKLTWPDRPVLPACTHGDGSGALGEMAELPLSSLTYVVFNTVVTGLDPLAESDILAIAGVRIAGLRILADDCCQSLVNPQRPIPVGSVKLHEISDGAVRGKPPIKVALAQFKAFAGDAVLVAHNAAIDLALLQHKGEKAKVGFDNILLDTLLLSMVADAETTDHTLPGLCRRLGVPMRGRHAAMATSLLTAQVFLHLLDMLKAKGITTLGQALAAMATVRP